MINLSNDGSKFCFTHFSARWTDTDLNDTDKVPVYTYEWVLSETTAAAGTLYCVGTWIQPDRTGRYGALMSSQCAAPKQPQRRRWSGGWWGVFVEGCWKGKRDSAIVVEQRRTDTYQPTNQPTRLVLMMIIIIMMVLEWAWGHDRERDGKELAYRDKNGGEGKSSRGFR